MKRSFFQAAVTSILLYGCTTWTLTKRLEKKLDGNYTRMLRAILNKSWQQHPTRHQLYGHLPRITKTIQVRRTRHAGHCWRSRDELIRDVLLWIPTHGRAKAGRRTFSSYVRIRDVVLKTCLGRWTIGRSGERGSGISVLPARYDDDDIFSEHGIIPGHASGLVACLTIPYLSYCISLAIKPFFYLRTCWLFLLTQLPPCLIVSLLRTQQWQWMIRFKLITRKYPHAVCKTYNSSNHGLNFKVNC